MGRDREWYVKRKGPPDKAIVGYDVRGREVGGAKLFGHCWDIYASRPLLFGLFHFRWLCSHYAATQGEWASGFDGQEYIELTLKMWGAAEVGPPRSDRRGFWRPR